MSYDHTAPSPEAFTATAETTTAKGGTIDLTHDQANSAALSRGWSQNPPQWTETLAADHFERRHLGPDEQAIAQMLRVLGFKSIEEFDCSSSACWNSLAAASRGRRSAERNRSVEKKLPVSQPKIKCIEATSA